MKLSARDIRQRFIRYFQETLGHLHLPSASLVPNNPTVLLTPAGMLPFVPIFLGLEPPPAPPRVVTVQKCARVSGKASDLEYVGRTARHHTFFEMLGNFSFGDYFKADAIPWAWHLMTEVLEIPPERLYVTVFHQDLETRKIWEETVGLPSARVVDRGEKDNFWGPPGPTGPCGPCSEIYFDRGAQYACGMACDFVTCDCDRYAEVWNLVFMELFQDADGKRSPLAQKNVDTGMGLERMAMVMQGVENTFETDLLFPIVQKAAELTGHRYRQDPQVDVALKIVTDHMRFVTFAIGDGIVPSNEGRGYIVRMILRRAVRYARFLGMQAPMLFKLVSTIRDLYQDPYTELKTQYNPIVEAVKAEEKRFLETLERGSRLLEEVTTELQASGQTVIPGEAVFKLYDTYGFPVELTRELAGEKGFSLDEAGFDTAMTRQRDMARAAQGDKTIVANQVYADILQETGPTAFLGYDTLDAEGTVRAIVHAGQRVTTFGGVNQPFELILDQTPFYGESGGQVGDQGILYVPAGEKGQTIVARDTQKVGDLVVHQCLFDQGGSITVGDILRLEVNPDARIRTARHHSATHLLHAALKHLLGDHVSQAGSHVGPDGARFDFTYPRALTDAEVQQLEMLVNRWILDNTSREVTLTDVESAKKAGAVAMFNEKYGDHVRMITFGVVSKELCGGTHVERLGDIGLFRITSESAIASGVRRLTYVAGELALHAMCNEQDILSALSETLKSPPDELALRVTRLLEERKQQEKQIKTLQEKAALAQIHPLLATAQETAALVTVVSVESVDTLRFMAETLSARLPDHLILLGAALSGKAHFVAVSPSVWQEKGIKAGELVSAAARQCEGGGGGKPHFAQAGGKRGEKVSEVIRQYQEQFCTAAVGAE